MYSCKILYQRWLDLVGMFNATTRKDMYGHLDALGATLMRSEVYIQFETKEAMVEFQLRYLS